MHRLLWRLDEYLQADEDFKFENLFVYFIFKQWRTFLTRIFPSPNSVDLATELKISLSSLMG